MVRKVSIPPPYPIVFQLEEVYSRDINSLSAREYHFPPLYFVRFCQLHVETLIVDNWLLSEFSFSVLPRRGSKTFLASVAICKFVCALCNRGHLFIYDISTEFLAKGILFRQYVKQKRLPAHALAMTLVYSSAEICFNQSAVVLHLGSLDPAHLEQPMKRFITQLPRLW